MLFTEYYFSIATEIINAVSKMRTEFNSEVISAVLLYTSSKSEVDYSFCVYLWEKNYNKNVYDGFYLKKFLFQERNLMFHFFFNCFFLLSN